MIQLILYFALGFLCAVFLSALIAPAFWRRAVILTRRRIEASVPLTGDEIRAERDGIRARHAVEARRLALDLQTANERAAAIAMQHAREREDIKAARQERDAAKSATARIEQTLREAHEEMNRRQSRIDAVTEALHKTEAKLEEQIQNYEQLAQQFDETSMSSSARQIELVARETEISRLASDISTLKGKNKSTDRIARGAESRIKAADDAAEAERRRADELDFKLLNLLATLSDRDEKLERREREIARLRERLRPIMTASVEESADMRLADLASENVRLEAEVLELGEQLKQKGTPEQPIARRPEKAKLREKMAELAAQVVSITAAIEGPDSTINRILEKRDYQQPGAPGTSLADRVRAIQTSVSQE